MLNLSKDITQMSTSLSNRKEFKQELSEYLDNLVITPELKHNLTFNQVSESFARDCQTLLEKMEFVKSNQLENSQAYKDTCKILQL